MGNQIALRLLGRAGHPRGRRRARSTSSAYERGAAGDERARSSSTSSTTPTASLDAGAVAAPSSCERQLAATSAPCSSRTPTWRPAACRGTSTALDAVAAVGLPVHLDGARLFNAAVATGIDVGDYAARADDRDVLPVEGPRRAGRVAARRPGRRSWSGPGIERKRLGGAMRQAGVLAAPGLVALRDHVERLADDHARARRLAEAVAERWPGSPRPDAVRTNIVRGAADPTPPKVLDHLGGRGRAGRHARARPRCGSSPTSTSTTPASTGPAGRWPPPRDRAVTVRLDRLQPASALAVYAHPDDPEVSCGGTLARWARGGAEVHLVIVNRGEKGAVDPADADTLAAVRAVEVEKAAEVLGLAGCELLGPARRRDRERPRAAGAARARSCGGCGPRSWCAPTPPRCTSATAT